MALQTFDFLNRTKIQKILLVVAFVISQLIVEHLFIWTGLNQGYFTDICIWDSHNLTHTGLSGLDWPGVVPLALSDPSPST